MDVVILAAGRGTRMKQYTNNINKVMLPLQDKTPILAKTIEACKANGLKKFVFVVGYKAESIMKYFKDGSEFAIKTVYVHQDLSKKGTASAVDMAKPFITSKQFVLIYGDIIPTVQNIANLISIPSNTSSMGIRKVEDPSRHGVVVLDKQEEKIIRIVEKSPDPPSNMINSGIYVLQSPEIFKSIAQTKKSIRGEYELTDSIQMLIDDGGIMYQRNVQDGLQDIGTILEYEKLFK